MSSSLRARAIGLEIIWRPVLFVFILYIEGKERGSIDKQNEIVYELVVM